MLGGSNSEYASGQKSRDGETRGLFNDMIMFWNVLGYEFHAAMENLSVFAMLCLVYRHLIKALSLTCLTTTLFGLKVPNCTTGHGK
jgi:hypothetical protein